ncbi:MAG: hypothetical protein COT15_03865 [Candidatus Diapherotrites archaeon CG08_land_8_20_14_0_20_34_12]|nr:MAG: hypothetical protein COT15_03865 [Candidatus Diapherotrites archaeon CG08_land_8_20_14_0_20_34_12]
MDFKNISIIVIVLLSMLLILGCIIPAKKLAEKEEFCYKDFEKDVNLCFLNDKTETFVFLKNCEDYLPQKFSEVFVVKDLAECKVTTSKKYDKIAPIFVPGTYPAYIKENDKIRIVCEPTCDVNPEVLDWKLERWTKAYDKLADFLGIDRLWGKSINFVLYNQHITENMLRPKGSSTIPFVLIPSAHATLGGDANISLMLGRIFDYLSNHLNEFSLDNEKVLHQDYVDGLYEAVFEDLETPIHEMAHVSLYSIGVTSESELKWFHESFAYPVAIILAGNKALRNKIKYEPYKNIEPESLCYEGFKYLSDVLLYNLCKNYGFDVNMLPNFFYDLNSFNTKYAEIPIDPLDTELKKGLIENNITKALNKVTGKDVSALFKENENCYWKVC